MKRALTLPIALAIAVPLFGADAKKSDEKPVQPAAPVHAAAQPAVQKDSPLVAAAKRANRLGKRPGTVITNESVLASKGHITTTTVVREVNVPAPELGPEGKLVQEKAEKAAEAKRAQGEIAAKEKAAAEEKARQAAQAAAAAEEGVDGGRDDADAGYFGQTGTQPPQF